MSVDRKELLTYVYAEAAKGNGRPFGELLSDDIVYVVKGQTPWSGTYRGRDAMLNRCIRPVRKRIKGGTRFWADRIIVDGDLAAIEGRGENETLEGVRYDNQYCWILRFADGKIVEMVEYMDTALTAAALGAPCADEGPDEVAA